MNLPKDLDNLLKSNLLEDEEVIWGCRGDVNWLAWLLMAVFLFVMFVEALKYTWLAFPNANTFCENAGGRRCYYVYWTGVPLFFVLTISCMLVVMHGILVRLDYIQARIVITTKRILRIWNWPRYHIFSVDYIKMKPERSAWMPNTVKFGKEADPFLKKYPVYFVIQEGQLDQAMYVMERQRNANHDPRPQSQTHQG